MSPVEYDESTLPRLKSVKDRPLYESACSAIESLHDQIYSIILGTAGTP